LCFFYLDLSKVLHLKMLVHLVWTPLPPPLSLKGRCYSKLAKPNLFTWYLFLPFWNVILHVFYNVIVLRHHPSCVVSKNLKPIIIGLVIIKYI
jgi:hypothetical protein